MNQRHVRTLASSRRSFLKRAAALSAAAVAAPYIVPASVLGANAPSNRITMAFIGTGRQAMGANIPQFIKLPDVQVLAVCDVDSWRLDVAQKYVNAYYAKSSPGDGYKGCKAYRDFREILDRKDVDTVMISTPDHWHAPIAIAALKAGKDVSLEKPITRAIDEGRVIADLCAKYKRVFRVDSEFRSLPPFHRAAELVRNGRIGKLHTVRTGCPREVFPEEAETITAAPPAELDYEMWLGPAPEVPYMQKRVHPPKDIKSRGGWMRNLDYCDGMICNWGTHLNDIGQWGAGTERTGPVAIKATGVFHDSKVWNVLESFDAWYQFASGLELFYTMGKPHVRFEGDKGWIQVDFPPAKENGGLSASDGAILKEVIGPNEVHFPLKTEKVDFIDAVKSRGQTLEDAEVGQRTTSLCHLAHISIKLGGVKLAWDPDKETFVGNDAANALTKRPPLRAPWTVSA